MQMSRGLVERDFVWKKRGKIEYNLTWLTWLLKSGELKQFNHPGSHVSREGNVCQFKLERLMDEYKWLK